jgi:CubicO group peptidase (beta-lactamase class C family)
MNRRRYHALAVVLVLVALAPGRPCAAASAASPLAWALPESVGLSTSRLAQATELLRQFVAERKIAGAVAAVSRRGKLAYLEAIGAQDVERRTPMDGRSIFRIYSMTKSVTAPNPDNLRQRFKTLVAQSIVP